MTSSPFRPSCVSLIFLFLCAQVSFAASDDAFPAPDGDTIVRFNPMSGVAKGPQQRRLSASLGEDALTKLMPKRFQTDGWAEYPCLDGVSRAGQVGQRLWHIFLAAGLARALGYSMSQDLWFVGAMAVGAPLVLQAIFGDVTPWHHHVRGFSRQGSVEKAATVATFLSVGVFGYLYLAPPLVAALASQRTSPCLSGDPFTQVWSYGAAATLLFCLAVDVANRACQTLSPVRYQTKTLVDQLRDGVELQCHKGHIPPISSNDSLWRSQSMIKSFGRYLPLVGLGGVYWFLRNGYVSDAVVCAVKDGKAVYTPSPDVDPSAFMDMQYNATNAANLGMVGFALMLPWAMEQGSRSVGLIHRVFMDCMRGRRGRRLSFAALALSHAVAFTVERFCYLYMNNHAIPQQGRLVRVDDIQPLIVNSLFVEISDGNPSVLSQVAQGAIDQASAVDPVQGATMAAVLNPFIASIAAALNPAAPSNPIATGINEPFDRGLPPLAAGYGFAQGSGTFPATCMGILVGVVVIEKMYGGIRRFLGFVFREKKTKSRSSSLDLLRKALPHMSIAEIRRVQRWLTTGEDPSTVKAIESTKSLKRMAITASASRRAKVGRVKNPKEERRRAPTDTRWR